MKLAKLAITLATAGSFVVAQPHKHHHRHAGKRSPDGTKITYVSGPTVVAYELNGQIIPQSEVCDGLAAGTLKFANGEDASVCSSATPTSAVSTVASSSPSSAPSTSSSSSSVELLGNQLYQQQTSTTPSVPSSTNQAPSSSSFSTISQSSAIAASSPSSSSSAAASASASASANSEFTSSSYSSSSDGQGLNTEFPGGTIDCSEFPSNYGPIQIPWLNIGGWSGIQNIQVSGGQVTYIETVVAGQGNCSEGCMCSYACPPGFQKSQWPTTQGSTGQSVGGLKCSGGKLHLTNSGLSKNLCIQGTGNVQVENTLSTNAAICRTDYPGTEDETVPLNTQAGSTNPLTCPDASSYFQHQGASTSAQYYINNKGVAETDACQWNKDGSNEGNWAPSYLGVGMDTSGKTWLAISSTAQNNPTNYKPLDYTVEIVGDNLSDKCRLQNGQYCSGSGYGNCNTQGCTVEVLSGTAKYVLSD